MKLITNTLIAGVITVLAGCGSSTGTNIPINNYTPREPLNMAADANDVYGFVPIKKHDYLLYYTPLQRDKVTEAERKRIERLTGEKLGTNHLSGTPNYATWQGHFEAIGRDSMTSTGSATIKLAFPVHYWVGVIELANITNWGVSNVAGIHITSHKSKADNSVCSGHLCSYTPEITKGSKANLNFYENGQIVYGSFEINHPEGNLSDGKIIANIKN